jgi:hypothetical protein
MSFVSITHWAACLVDQVLQVRSAHTRTPSSNDGGVDLNIGLYIRHVVLENLDSSPHVRQTDNDY